MGAEFLTENLETNSVKNPFPSSQSWLNFEHRRRYQNGGFFYVFYSRGKP
jgi:hypothetical protein